MKKVLLLVAALLAGGCQSAPVRPELTGKVTTDVFDAKTGKVRSKLGGEVSFKLTQ